jgi:Tfp pilus assembly protein PilE
MRKKSKNIMIVIAVLLLIICIAAVVAYLYFTTDTFKSNKELFFKYLAQNVDVIDQYLEDPNKTTMDTLKTSPYTVKSNISFDLVSSDAEIADQTTPPRNFSVAYTKNADPQEDAEYSEVKVKYLTKDLAVGKYVRNGDTNVVNVYNSINDTNLFNVYLGIENSNLKQLAQKFGIQDVSYIPNKIESISLSDLLSLTQVQEQYIQTVLLNVVNNQISKDNFYREKGVTIEIDSKQVKTNSYGIKLTSTEYQNFVVALLNEISQDDTILGIIVNKISLVDSETDVTTATLKQQIQNYITQINADGFTNGITIQVYEANGKIVRTQIEKNSLEYYIIDTERANNSIRSIISMNYTYETTNEEEQDNTGVVFTEDGYQIIEGSASGEEVIEEVETSTYTVKKLEFAKQISGNQSNVIAIITYEANDDLMTVSVQNKTDGNQDGFSNNIIVNINNSDTTYFTIKANSTITPVSSVSIPTLTSGSYAVFNNFTSDYIVKILSGTITQLFNMFNQQMEVAKEVQEQQDAQNSTLIPVDSDMLEMNTITERDDIID